jgi:hypothetical protein
MAKVEQNDTPRQHYDEEARAALQAHVGRAALRANIDWITALQDAARAYHQCLELLPDQDQLTVWNRIIDASRRSTSCKTVWPIPRSTILHPGGAVGSRKARCLIAYFESWRSCASSSRPRLESCEHSGGTPRRTPLERTTVASVFKVSFWMSVTNCLARRLAILTAP